MPPYLSDTADLPTAAELRLVFAPFALIGVLAHAEIVSWDTAARRWVARSDDLESAADIAVRLADALAARLARAGEIPAPETDQPGA